MVLPCVAETAGMTMSGVEISREKLPVHALPLLTFLLPLTMASKAVMLRAQSL